MNIENNIEALFYDLDGTLLNSYEAHWRAYKESFETSGYSISEDLYKSAFGLDFIQMINIVCPEFPHNKINDLKEKKFIYFKKNIDYIIPNEALIALMRNISNQFKVGIVSSGSKKNVDYVLNYFNLKQYFDVIITGDDVKKQKPLPDPYLLAAKTLRVLPGKCIVFEDSDTGIQSAIDAGMKAIKVSVYD